MPVSAQSLDQLSYLQFCDAEQICSHVARIFGVKTTEVGLLRLQGGYLKFVFPYELRTLGAIPLMSSAVAAKTALNKSADVFNDFVRVKHASIFEMVKLGTKPDEPAMDAQTIQKMMSMAIVDDLGNTLGVIQVSRKGPTQRAAGADFSHDDLQQLVTIRPALARALTKLKE